MKIIKAESVPNPVFVRDVYEIAYDCKGCVYIDKTSNRVVHELFDGKNSIAVPEMVFAMWLKAYESGKEDALKNLRDDRSNSTYED